MARKPPHLQLHPPGAAKDSPLTKENLYSFIEKHKSKDFTYIQEAKDFISRDVVLPIVGNQMTKDGNFTFLRTDSAMSYPEGISYVLITCAKASGITSLAVDEKATVKFSSFAVAGVKDNEFRIVPNTPCVLDKQVVISAPAACADCPEMVVIPAGSFEMGGTNSDEQPVHRVTLRSFSMGKTEVTQGQWRAVMGSNPSSFSNCGDNCPVEQVSWEDAKQFVSRLSAKTGKTYRLPSETEWEYACRAGGRQEYCGSDRADNVGWYYVNSGNATHPVAGKQVNAWGLHDMSGNVWEWTEDCWNQNYSNAPTDGSVWTSGACSQRVVRGGSWINNPQYLRSASRFRSTTANRYYNLGFRVARTN